jgi:hypothetical protein
MRLFAGFRVGSPESAPVAFEARQQPLVDACQIDILPSHFVSFFEH